MRKRRIEILLISLTALALGAGLAAGLLAARLPTVASSSSSSSSGSGDGSTTGVSSASGGGTIERTPLVEELQLTPEQRDQMREIWESTRGRVHQTFEDAQRLQKDRDDALVQMLNDEQKAQFQRISKDYADRFDNLAKKRDQAFADAVEKTRSILNEMQRQKYEQILRRHVGADGPGTRRGPANRIPPPDALGERNKDSGEREK